MLVNISSNAWESSWCCSKFRPPALLKGVRKTWVSKGSKGAPSAHWRRIIHTDHLSQHTSQCYSNLEMHILNREREGQRHLWPSSMPQAWNYCFFRSIISFHSILILPFYKWGKNSERWNSVFIENRMTRWTVFSKAPAHSTHHAMCFSLLISSVRIPAALFECCHLPLRLAAVTGGGGRLPKEEPGQ